MQGKGEVAETPREFSDVLLEAAARVNELSAAELSRLLLRAAIRLRVIKQAGANLEHVPVYAYNLVRNVSRQSVSLASLHGREDEAALEFLLSRRLVELSQDRLSIVVTEAGLELGSIADEWSQKGERN